MTRWELLKILDEQYPFEHQEEWDRCGANFGPSYDEVVSGAVIALDLTTEAINFAIENKANVIITHHPLLMNDEKNPTAANLFKTIQENNIVHVALHTCFDMDPEGTSYQIAKMIAQGEIKTNPENPYIVTFQLGVAMHLKFFVQFLGKFPLFTSLKYDRTMAEKQIQTVAIVAGSGSAFFGDVLLMKEPKVDCFITGDVKWHTYIDAKENGLAMVDIGHGSEYIFVKTIKKLLETRNIPLYELPLTVQIVDGKNYN